MAKYETVSRNKLFSNVYHANFGFSFSGHIQQGHSTVKFTTFRVQPRHCASSHTEDMSGIGDVAYRLVQNEYVDLEISQELVQAPFPRSGKLAS